MSVLSKIAGRSHPNQWLGQSMWVGRCLTGSVIGTMLIGMAMTPAAMAQEQRLRTLTVTGVGVENIQTTLAVVRLGVEAKGNSAQAVQEEVARRSSSVVSLLRSRNVEKLETTGINLSPNYSYINNRRQLRGYQGSNIVSFRVATEKAGPLLDQAVQAGASRIDRVSFRASDQAVAAAQKTALGLATQDAQDQAKAVLSALSLTPGDIVSIQVNGANVPPPRPVPALAEARVSAAPPTPVIGGEQAVRASVTLQMSY